MSAAHSRSTTKTVGVRELRQNLSRYLERVKDGETLTVTEHGHEVARLVPSHGAIDPYYIELAEQFGATVPTKNLLQVIDNLPPGRSHPTGTTDTFLNESRHESF
jgi:prevent-host-death family protein